MQKKTLQFFLRWWWCLVFRLQVSPSKSKKRQRPVAHSASQRSQAARWRGHSQMLFFSFLKFFAFLQFHYFFGIYTIILNRIACRFLSFVQMTFWQMCVMSIVICSTHPEKSIRDDVVAQFLLLSVVMVTLRNKIGQMSLCTDSAHRPRPLSLTS